MRRRQVLLGLAAVAGTQLCTGGAALAAGFADEIVAQLRKQGFGNIVVERTWLGRTRILAERRDARREIILNPNTGEILRDLWLSKSGKPVQGARISDDDNEEEEDETEDPADPEEPDNERKGDNSGSGGGD